MSELLWSALEQVHAKVDDEGLEAVIALEKDRSYVEAQQQLTTYLSSKEWVPLWELLAKRLASFNPETGASWRPVVGCLSKSGFQRQEIARHFSKAICLNDISLFSRKLLFPRAIIA